MIWEILQGVGDNKEKVKYDVVFNSLCDLGIKSSRYVFSLYFVFE